jgi:hypothetical protein
MSNTPVSDFMKFCLVILHLSHAIDRYGEVHRYVFPTSWSAHLKMHLHVVNSESDSDVIMILVTKQMLLILWKMVTEMIGHLTVLPPY